MQLPEGISQTVVDTLIEIINKRGLETIREMCIERMADEMIECSIPDLVDQFMTLAQYGCKGLNSMTVEELAIEIAGDFNDDTEAQEVHEMWDELEDTQ
jgi:hypothetical protein